MAVILFIEEPLDVVMAVWQPDGLSRPIAVSQVTVLCQLSSTLQAQLIEDIMGKDWMLWLCPDNDYSDYEVTTVTVCC